MSDPTPTSLNALWARAIIDACVLGGVRHAVVCPGSRSTPLALACVEDSRLKTWSVIDERTAGFFALGLGVESGAPALVLVTSGTAGAHLYPAVLEAELSRVPMIVLTADRPWELHGFGAAQTLDQANLFGAHVRAFADLGLSEASDQVFRHLRSVVGLGVSKALAAPRGPVHFNIPFREPLSPVPGKFTPTDFVDSGAGTFRRAQVTTQAAIPDEVRETLRREVQGVIVVGPRAECDGLDLAVAALSTATGYPVLAEAASNVRYGTGGAPLYDLYLRDDDFARTHRPKVIVRLGGGLTSKKLSEWLDASDAQTVQISGGGIYADPNHRSTVVLEGAPPAILRALTPDFQRGPTAWTRDFAAQQERVASRLERAFTADSKLTEPRIASEVVRALAPNTQLLLASSMPVRDVDAFAPIARVPVRVFSNRGANGIDGTLASALGIAAASGKPTVALVGDLAFLHDLNSLLIAHRSGIALTVVVVNNDGGGIFSFLPVAGIAQNFELLFGTPHGLTFERAAELYRAHYTAPKTVTELRAALTDAIGRPGLRIIEVQVESSRTENVAVHQALYRAVLDSDVGGTS